ncbi:MAG: STAS domain-containing protein [Terriglobia bacterium]|nr:STAS domain-containing protein [Terriglobia bacterium]
MELSLEIRTHGESAVLACKGRLTDMFSKYLFCEAVEELLEKHRNVVLDLACLEKMDAAALGAIAGCIRDALDHHTTLRCFGVNKEVRQLLDVTRLSPFLRFYNTEDEAVAAALNACAA